MKREKNLVTRHSILLLEKESKKTKAPIWKESSSVLAKPRSIRLVMNIGHLSKVKGSVVFVPGKVLGSGLLVRKVSVGAYAFSPAARKKITDAGGTALSIEEFLKKYPDGSEVVLVN
jgi:large subunit ribosomal protein L18e